jgi:CheY-like chemotaxis protein
MIAHAKFGAQMAQRKSMMVLLVEDDAVHARMILRVFRDMGHADTIVHVSSGEAALDYLLRPGAGAEPRPSPDLVLLDLQLPEADGFDVLQAVRGDQGTRTIPVVVVSTSDRQEDVFRCYRLGANAYVAKSPDFEAFVRKIRALRDFWGLAVELPAAL